MKSKLTKHLMNKINVSESWCACELSNIHLYLCGGTEYAYINNGTLCSIVRNDTDELLVVAFVSAKLQIHFSILLFFSFRALSFVVI